MTGVETVLEAVRTAGCTLSVEAGTLVLDGPVAAQTDDLVSAIRVHRQLLLEHLTPATDPCGACGTQAWWQASDWPVPGAARWLCATCCTRLVPTMVALYGGLDADQRARLDGEALDGDPLAALVLEAVRVESTRIAVHPVALALERPG